MKKKGLFGISVVLVWALLIVLTAPMDGLCQDKKYDSYSGFQDDGGAQTEMKDVLQKNGIKELIVYCIATDYCVKATAIDAADSGYKVTVVEGLSKGVAPDTTAKALEEMKAKGIIIKTDLEM